MNRSAQETSDPRAVLERLHTAQNRHDLDTFLSYFDIGAENCLKLEVFQHLATFLTHNAHIRHVQVGLVCAFADNLGLPVV